MTKLTTERLEQYAHDKHMCNINDEIREMARQLLAYEQAAKNPVAWIVHMRTGDQFTTDGDFVGLGEAAHGIHSTPLYAAPVLPKQPELVEKLKKVMNKWLAMEPKLAFQPEFTDVMMLLDAEPAHAQPVIQEPKYSDFHDWLKDQNTYAYQVASGELEASEDEVINAKATIMDMSIGWKAAIQSGAQAAIPDEITSASAPEVFEIAAEAERLGLRGTYASYAVGWNAYRAAMLKAQQNKPQNIPENIPAQPVSEPYKLPDNLDFDCEFENGDYDIDEEPWLRVRVDGFNEALQVIKRSLNTKQAAISALSPQPVSEPKPVGYFSYGSECGFDSYKTEKEAIESAEAAIDDYRGDACDGWSEETDSICWGVILQQATKVGERPRTDDDKCDPAIDTVCDYALLPVREG